VVKSNLFFKASDVQNLTIHLKILERKSNLTREKIRNIRYRLNSIEIENEKGN
jgi:hypothetical protein